MPKQTRKQQHAALLRQARTQYDTLLQQQNGVCGICGRPPGGRRLDVDHDHRTMTIRGLLCHRCNRGLHWFSDDPGRLRAAAAYLEGKVHEEGRRLASSADSASQTEPAAAPPASFLNTPSSSTRR